MILIYSKKLMSFPLCPAVLCLRISKDSKEDKVRSNRYWNEGVVKKLMSIDYQGKWIGNWFWPYNIFRYWFTAYDRSDIMAQTFEDNLFDVSPIGSELKFRDLNPERPYLIINATDGTENIGKEKHFGELFTFTKEDFSNKLNSDINSYSVARAVMASAAFPGAFNYMTLMDYRNPKVKDERYLHLFDGGN
ncbi:MAG: patatin-like phospholipase family protein, partial [Deltaproteobacteria bacterium]|nr:patatin-like phospholipase family protein [Deltaproteobacteria bacterium]